MKYLSFLICVGILPSWFGLSVQSEILIEPPGLEKNRSVYLAKSGDGRFAVSCVYSGDDADGIHAIQWINEDGKVINPSTSIIVYSKKNEKKLIFVNIKRHDSGEYRCRVQLKSGEFLEKRIFVRVISNIKWNIPTGVVGGNVNEPLTIDCGAYGDPEPVIEIANAHGRSIEEDGFKVINNQVTIENLTREHQGLVFKCLAVQKVNLDDKFNATTTEDHKLTVDVYFAPKFDTPEVVTYTTFGKNVTLNCVVMDSNPHVERFNFYRGSQIIFNHDRYEVVTNVTQRMSALGINFVDDDDYGRYKCVAYNGKLSSEQTFILKKTAPPKQPIVEIMDVFNNSVVLRVKENRENEDDLPVLSYTVTYVPKEYHRAPRDGDQNVSVKLNERRTKYFNRNINNSYKIEDLEQDVQYEILISPVNEVGEGDPVLINVVTGSNKHDLVFSSSITFRVLNNFLLYGFLVITTSFLCYW